jgi:hypothetical protein
LYVIDPVYINPKKTKHADKILCPITGAHSFPSEATYIPSKIWKKIQDFQVIVSSYRNVRLRSTSVNYGRMIWTSSKLVAKENPFVRIYPGFELLG